MMNLYNRPHETRIGVVVALSFQTIAISTTTQTIKATMLGHCTAKGRGAVPDSWSPARPYSSLDLWETDPTI